MGILSRIRFVKFLFLITAGIAVSISFMVSAIAANIYSDNGELHYMGEISKESNEILFKTFNENTYKPSVLSIRSKGGDAEAGIDLGNWVRNNNISIKVLEYCFSSCANYVFTAAKKKVVSNFSVIGYHGGLSSSSFTLGKDIEDIINKLPKDDQPSARDEIIKNMKLQLEEKNKSEIKFFSSIGVQQSITTIGQSEEFSKIHEDDDWAIGWTYSIEDFARFGVKDINIINPPWNPKLINSKFYVVTIKPK